MFCQHIGRLLRQNSGRSLKYHKPIDGLGQTRQAASTRGSTNKKIVPVPDTYAKLQRPKFDLNAIAAEFPDIPVHNPLVEIEESKKKERRLRKQKKAKLVVEVDYLEIRPLTIEEAYLELREDFFNNHEGIMTTPTRMYKDVEVHDATVNRKMAFGNVYPFKPLQSNVKDLYWEKPYQNEFDFHRGWSSYVEYLKLLELYVHFLHTLPVPSRAKYFTDFFYIIKAIRRQGDWHKRLVKNQNYINAVMSYFILCNQPNMALYLGREAITPLTMNTVDRWVVVRLMDIERVRSLPESLLYQLEKENKLSKTDGPAHVEELISLMASNILQYYKQSPTFTITDFEIIAMIRMYEGRGIKSSLRRMLPIVLQRFVDGATNEMPARDKVQLFYDPDILAEKVEDHQLVFRYALALMQLEGDDACLKMLHTISEMPPKYCSELRTDTQSIAKALIDMMNSGDFEGKVSPKYILRAISANNVEDPTANIHVSQQVQKALGDAIFKQSPPAVEAVAADYELLKKNPADLSPAEVDGIIQKLSTQPNQFAQLSWVSKTFFKLGEKAQGQALKWVANSLTEKRGRFIVFIGNYAKASPMKCAQFVHILSRRMWERESDRRSILSKAFSALISSGNPSAVGTMLVTIAMGPNSPMVSENGPQSIGERAKALANTIERHKAALAPMAPQLIPHLLKATESLKARRAERILLTELTRQGLPLDVRMAKAAIWIRMSNQVDQKQFLELIERVLQAFPISPADSLAKGPPSVLPVGHSALYITILKGLGHCRLVKSFELLASELIQSRRLNTRTFGALASIWLDTIGYGWKSTSSDVTRVWIILKDLTSSNKQPSPNGISYSLNLNHFHSVIEAYVRVGDISSAWDIIRKDMREYSIEPNIMTFYTLVSPLANKSTLWPIGKSVILRFKEFYPEVLKLAVEDKNNTLIFKALLRQALKDEYAT